MAKWKKWIGLHKGASALIAVAVLGGGYFTYGKVTAKTAPPTYILGTVTKGTLISSVSASGQVSSSDQADIKAKASGDIIWLSAKAGMHVSAGQIIATQDSTSAQRAVTDARLAVEQAQITLDRDTLQSPITYEQKKEDVQRAQQNLNDQYESVFASLSGTFTSLPDVVKGADDLLHKENDIGDNSPNITAYQNLFVTSQDAVQLLIRQYANRAEADYLAARTAYDASLTRFKTLRTTSSTSDLEAALVDTKKTAALVAQALSSETNLIDTVIDTMNTNNLSISTKITAAQTSARSFLNSANTVSSSVSAAAKSLDTSKNAVTDAQHALDVATVGNESNGQSFDLKLELNTVNQKKAALADAQQALADYSIRAPFAGVLATVSAKRGDSASNGTAIATVITDQRIAELSLNEVDATKIKLGQKATLTFDAITDLSLTGKVLEIDSIGTVTQGVVSYKVKIGFDSNDARVKPGMSVNAAIIIDVKQDVLKVPSSAVKTTNGGSFVSVFTPALSQTAGTQGVTSATPPEMIPVEIGISDDTETEVVSGLTEGQQVVVRTVTAATVATQSAPSLFGGGARATGGGNATFRATGR